MVTALGQTVRAFFEWKDSASLGPSSAIRTIFQADLKACKFISNGIRKGKILIRSGFLAHLNKHFH